MFPVTQGLSLERWCHRRLCTVHELEAGSIKFALSFCYIAQGFGAHFRQVSSIAPLGGRSSAWWTLPDLREPLAKGTIPLPEATKLPTPHMVQMLQIRNQPATT